MRLLVLDGSRILFHLIERLVPVGVEVTHSTSFNETVDLVERHKTDAVVADLSHAELPWREFQKLCCNQNPQIPVLFQSSIYGHAEETQLGELCECNSFVSAPCHASELRMRLGELLRSARERNGCRDYRRAPLTTP